MADNYDDIDELMDWEEMDRELEASNRGSKQAGCGLLPCLSTLTVVLLIVGAMILVL